MTGNRTAALCNLGCKVNAYETDAMEKLLREAGYVIVPFDSPADVYVINTCSVTNMADRKSRQMLHRAKKLSPDSVIVAAGCYVQGAKDVDDAADLWIGNHEKNQLVPLLEKVLTEKKKLQEVSEIGEIRDYEDMVIASAGERTRAFIKVQDGCNQFCSYCLIPYVRGRVRSRKIEDVVREIQELTEKGFQEFVLTGIHLSSYGTDFGGEAPKADQFGEEQLLELIENVHAIEGVKRIRLGSLEPRIITEKFVGKLAALPKVCPHFHLSLQSGCDDTLKRMNRHYTAIEYAEGVEILRRKYEHPAITTDVIVGFPGEDEREFGETVAFLENLQLFEMHIFKYSSREGTVAAKMPQSLTDREKSERSDVLEEMTIRQSAAFRKFYEGKRVSVLFEEEKEIGGKQYFVGHTPEYCMVAVEAKDALENHILDVCIEMEKDGIIFGKVDFSS